MHREFAEVAGNGCVAGTFATRSDDGKPAVVCASATCRAISCQHAVALFLRPVLAHHDRDAFRDLFCYSNNGREDDGLTARISRSRVDHWRNIVRAGRCRPRSHVIRADDVDILVDLRAFGSRSRMSAVQPRRCAPRPGDVARLPQYDRIALRRLPHLRRATLIPQGWRSHCIRNDSLRLAEQPVVLHACLHAMSTRAPRRATTSESRRLRIVQPMSRRSAKPCVDLLAAHPARGARCAAAGYRRPAGRARRSAFGERFAGRRRSRAGRVHVVAARSTLIVYFEAIAGADVALDTFPYNGGDYHLATRCGLGSTARCTCRRPLRIAAAA